ncbi:MAG: methyltransferase [Pseudonocardiaceae bacterium]
MTRTVMSDTAPVTVVRELALAAGFAAVLRAAVKLGLADVLGGEPASAERLAALVGAEPGALRRLLRALACHGFFAEDGQGRYVHTDPSRLLRRDAPRSMRYMVMWVTEPWTWQAWPKLDEAVRTGRDVFHDLYGDEFFAWLHAHAPESADVFDRAMTQSSNLSSEVVADALDLSEVRTVVDIAGGQGHLLSTLLQRNVHLNGVLLDLPGVVANADPRLREGGALASRARLLPGDCRAAVPVEADLYVLKNILECDDERTVTTLRNVVSAARPGARVAVIQNLVDGNPEVKFNTGMDLLLLLNVGGKRHTERGLVELIEQAGLKVEAVRPAGPYLHLIESTVP